MKAKTKKAQRGAAKEKRRNKEFARQAAAQEQAKKNPTPKKVYQGDKYAARRIDVKVEEFDGYTITSWTDPRITASTAEARVRQYMKFGDERRKEDDMFGFGFRQYNAYTNRVEDYMFTNRKGYETYYRRTVSVEGVNEMTKKSGVTTNDSTPLEVEFPSIGVTKIDLRNPENEEYLDYACELVARMRYGEISQEQAMLYAALFIEPFKKAA